MDRSDAAEDQQTEQSRAVVKRPRSADGPPDGSPEMRPRWGDSEDGDSAPSPAAGTALMLEDQTPIVTAALESLQGSDTRKPPSPRPQGWEWRAGGTGARAAAMPTQGSEYKSEASVTSGVGCEDQEATLTKLQDPVKLLRLQDIAALEAKNDTAIGAVYGMDPSTVVKFKALQPPATWIHIIGNDQTETGIDKFGALPQVKAVLAQLKYIDRVFAGETRCGRLVHFMSLEFSSKQSAMWARSRIIEEHKGVEWPPFAVIYASARYILQRAAEDA